MCPIQDYSPMLPTVQFTAYVPHASLGGFISYLVVWVFFIPIPKQIQFLCFACKAPTDAFCIADTIKKKQTTVRLAPECRPESVILQH